MAIFDASILTENSQSKIKNLDLSYTESVILQTINLIKEEDNAYTALKIELFDNLEEAESMLDLAIGDMLELIQKTVDNFIKIIKTTFNTFKRVYDSFLKKIYIKFKINEKKIKESLNSLSSDCEFVIPGYNYKFICNDKITVMHDEIISVINKIIAVKNPEDLNEIRNEDLINHPEETMNKLRASIMPKLGLGVLNKFNFLTVSAQYFRDGKYDKIPIHINKDYIIALPKNIESYITNKEFILKQCNEYKKINDLVEKNIKRILNTQWPSEMVEEITGYTTLLINSLKCANESVQIYLSTKLNSLNKSQIQNIQILKLAIHKSKEAQKKVGDTIENNI